MFIFMLITKKDNVLAVLDMRIIAIILKPIKVSNKSIIIIPYKYLLNIGVLSYI